MPYSLNRPLPNDTFTIPPTGQVPRPTHEQELTEHWKVQKQEMLQQRMEELRGVHPEWFNYSDTLGERPIDGMIRNILQQYKMLEENNIRLDRESDIKQRQIQQNRGVAPGYTEEIQQQAPEGSMMEMGPVL